MKKIILILSVASCIVVEAQSLKPFKKFRTNVPEPSDIAYTPDFSSFYIVSDQGILYQTDTLGKITKAAPFTGVDFEGVYSDDKNIYVADERTRRVHVYTQNTLEHTKQNEITYHGGMNEGYEGITFNQKKSCFVIVTEKNPIYFFELNSDLIKINETKLKIASDISAVYFYNDFMYALSDEDQTVFKLDPITYAVINKWKIPVTNPEGMAFDKQGNLVIVSDFEQTIFKFKLTENIK
jgi:uncharacterized protein YjiK